jgi:ATP-binding cassette subfamily B protein
MPKVYSSEDAALYKRILLQVRRCWPHLGMIGLLTFVYTPLKLLVPVPLAIAVDSVVGEQALPGWLASVTPTHWHASDSAMLWLAIGILIAVGLLTSIVTVALYVLKAWTSQRMILDFRAVLFDHAQRLSLQYHDKSGSTDTTYRIQYDAPAVRTFTMDGVIPFASSVLMLGGMFAVMFALDWQIGLVTLAVCPALLFLVNRWAPILRKGWKDVKRLESSAMGVIQEAIGSLRVVKAFGQEDRESDRFVHKATGSMKKVVSVSLSQSLFEVCSGLILLVGSGTILYLGVRHVQTGILTVGELILVWTYLAQINGPLQSVSTRLTTMQNALASAERSFDLLDATPDVVEKPHAKPIDRAKGKVAFESVAFAYGSGADVISDVTVTIQPGEMVGLVGQTGAGKSTLMNLLIRHNDPTRGRVLLDDTDLRDYKLDQLRDQYALVLQDSVLFQTTIRENIGYARPGATDQQIIEAAKAAHAHGFISQLADGYDTLIGERGQTLSGGERQRIAIARAFLRDAPILILDEPTSALDSRTEADILAAIRELMRGRTTFVIAHRLSTIRDADQILVLEQGRVIESGTHTGLMEAGGAYRRYVDQQERKAGSIRASVPTEELG